MHVHVDKAVGVGAAGASAAPAPLYGHFLTQNGIWILSYAEWIQCLGALYIIALLGNMTGLWRLIARLWKRK